MPNKKIPTIILVHGDQTGEELLEELRDVDPETTTPLDALQRLTEWKKRFGGE